MLIVGIDPGISGAIAFMRDGDLVNVEDLPVVEVAHGKGSREELSPQLLHDRLLDADVRIDVAVLEDVNAFGMGRTSAFRFGENVGTIKGVLAASGIRTVMVTPQKWKKAMGLGRDKALSRARAIELWPDSSHLFKRKMDHNRAEAALIAEWGRRNG